MRIFILVALIWVRPLMQDTDSGVVQIEFDSKRKCEEAAKVIEDKYNTSAVDCLEITK